MNNFYYNYHYYIHSQFCAPTYIESYRVVNIAIWYWYDIVKGDILLILHRVLPIVFNKKYRELNP